MDENVIIVRNKIRLTTQRFNKKEGIDYEHLLYKLKAIRMLLAFAYFKNFILCQMNMKSVLLNYIFQRKLMLNNFLVLITIIIQTIFLNLKRHYSLKQTLRAWYEKLKIFLLENGFKVGNIDIVFFF